MYRKNHFISAERIYNMNTTNKVKKILKRLCTAPKISVKDSLSEDLGIDSLGMVTLILELEEGFGITFGESDMNPFDLKTVGDVVALAKRYTEAKDEPRS